jgi:hypothetical protein
VLRLAGVLQASVARPRALQVVVMATYLTGALVEVLLALLLLLSGGRRCGC